MSSLKVILFALLINMVGQAQAQDYKINFTIEGDTKTPDKIIVKNITQGTEIELLGTDVLHLTEITTGIPTEENKQGELKVYPNPVTDFAIIEFYNPEVGVVNIEAYNILGTKVLHHSANLPIGTNLFKITGLSNGTHFVNVRFNRAKSSNLSSLIICRNTTATLPTIEYGGINNNDKQLKTVSFANSTVQMQYNTDDNIRFTAYYNDAISIQTQKVYKTQTLSFIFIQDVDGNSYSSVRIGDQVWMSENLKVTKDSVGNEIPSVIDENDNGNLDDEWAALENNDSDKAYCFYNNNANGEKDKYGALYTYAASLDVCPAGWHLPTDAEWTELETYISNDGHSGDEGKALKEKSSWKSNGNGTNNYGFSALGCGYRRNGGNGNFNHVNSRCFWWTNTTYSISRAYGRNLMYNNTVIKQKNYSKSCGFSVRCIKN